MRTIDVSLCKEVIKSKLDSIEYNQTWELVELPKGCKPTISKWIFKKKLRLYSFIDKYKDRLVIREFNKKNRVDYFDIYSPLTKISTIKTLVILATIHGLVVHQMKVKTTFLNGGLEEEIYMSQLMDVYFLGRRIKYVSLEKFLYGLKQAHKQQYKNFDISVIQNDFVVNTSDSCVYSKVIGSDYMIICLYVDDMLMFVTNVHAINKTKKLLSSHFEIKDMGKLM